MLTKVKNTLIKQMKSTDPSWQPWELYDGPVRMIGRRLVIPAYNDGYMVFGESSLWLGNDGMIYVIAENGMRDKFRNADEAVKFLLEV